jgi:protein CpxP
MTRRSIPGILAWTAVAITLAAAGGCRPARCAFEDPALFDRIINNEVNDKLDDLDATVEQRTRALALKDRIRSEFRATRAAREERNRSFVDEALSEAPDAARLHASLDAGLDELRADAHRLLDLYLENREILTPAQGARLRAMVAERRAYCQ